MDPALRFWVLVLAATGTVVSVVFLVVSSFLPGAVFGPGDTYAYVGSLFVALASLGALVWSLAVDGGPEDRARGS